MFKLKILFFIMLSLALMGAPVAAQVAVSCPLSGVTIDSQYAGGGIDGPGVVGQVYGTGCQVILEVTTTRSYWVNLRVTPVGNGLVLTPDGDLATSLMGYRVLPPLGTIRFNATFTAAGQSVMAILDGTASIDQEAREMTYVQAMVDLLSLTGVLDSTLTIDLLVEYYPALHYAMSASPNLQEAFLSLADSNYLGFVQSMQRAAAQGEVTVFGQTLMDVGAHVVADRLSSFIDDALGAGYLNALVVIFSNYGAVLSRTMSQPAGFIIFNAEGSTAPLVPDPGISVLNPVTRNADWTPVISTFDDGVPMVLVPPGCFIMGTTEEQAVYAINVLSAPADWVESEKPAHLQCFDHPFWLDQTEVTQTDFARLGGHKADPNAFDSALRPVETITWFEARDFCALRGARLPTEREWEYAARGPDDLVYPWGNDWVENNAVAITSGPQGIAEVGGIQKGASWVGAFDMSGNVWEWLNTIWGIDTDGDFDFNGPGEQIYTYPYLDDGREQDSEVITAMRVLRGGTWFLNDSAVLRTAYRTAHHTDFRDDYGGFRCARSDGTAAPVVTDPGVSAPNPVTRNADWTPVISTFDDGVPMVLVPPGCFMMGTDDAEIAQLNTEYGTDLFNAESPPHEQCFDQPFWIDQTEVTQADFVRLGGQKANRNYFDGELRPIESITWFEARDFCALRGGRLPTEAEWEYAARGPESWAYPWGDAFVERNAVYFVNSYYETANVGSRPAGASWVGAQDMTGNVWELTSSLFNPYPYNASDGREADTGSSTNVHRVLRGGSWYSDTDLLRVKYRVSLNPDSRDFSYGFRCARDFE